ncbi:MAG: phosphoglycerate kinase, partial [Alphaproteobacteria bacterium HGW-Alphaproteobacteria-2]
MAWKTLDDMELTVADVIERGGRPVLLSHFDRPKGRVVPEMSLGRLVGDVERELGFPVLFAALEEAEAASRKLPEGYVLLVENTRFHPGDEANDPDFAARLAALGDVFVNDAFSSAHRAHASTEGVARLLPACAGRLMEAELRALEAALTRPERPVVALVGGAKVSTKLALLRNLIEKVETLVIGGGMANTFLAARGVPVGRSLAEHDLA